MFTLPQAKRIRREDINDSASDEASSDEERSHNPQVESALRARLNAQLSGILNLNFTAGSKAQRQQVGRANDENPQEASKEEEAFVFRLFRDEAPSHTVVLTHDEDPAAQGDGGFVVPSRPRSHYIASAPSREKETEYRSVAVSAEYLLADAKKRRWGLEKPWRVIHIISGSSSTVPSKSRAKSEEPIAQLKEKKRTRPGKKHRLLLRVREKEKCEREEAVKTSALDKEQHLQEKKKRLNRERKLKRRQKEREKKAALQVGDGNGGETD
ncbi:hypothetical protein F5B22DRAFT_348951 [Xylaria bambusicola]|uniref:uncharacterized protein n=1 Tax=Xylaria bambusicola TaxID=326684 RepID=UPI002008CD93|nr:uncharacterized protein F5B22DRAFT_348951 [Xylaria bambusicola]KAI0525572.1 hypothetical protein F5B22DRAFT_348951 [Xylaria bambusicola]